MKWLETTKDPPKITPIKNPERLQLEYELIGFSNRAAEKLIKAIHQTIDKCKEFYKNVLTTYNIFHKSSKRRLDKLPPHEEQLKKLHARFQEDELGI